MVILLSALLCGATATHTLPARAQENASPATGHAQVVAHGIVPVPGAEIAWRVLTRNTSAEDLIAETGFLVVDRGTLLVVNQTTDEASLLAPGMALLTRGGDDLELTSPDGRTARYVVIELVLAGELAADAEPGFTSDSFRGSNALNAFALVRDVLADGEQTSVPPGTAPTLVLATAGSIDVATAPGQTPVRLAAGQSVIMGGQVSVAANAGPAGFVAAIVGPEVTLPAQAPVDGGSIEVVVRDCPAGYSGGASEIPDRFAADCREPLSGITFTLAGADGETSARTDASGRVRIDDVAPGDYVLTNDIPGEDRGFRVHCVNAILGGEASTARNQFEILMTAGAQVRCDWYVIPASDPSAGTGAISVQGLICPSAAAAKNTCEYTDEIFAGGIVLAGPAGVELTFGSGQSHAVSHVWEDVPYGTYYFSRIDLADPTGYRLERIDGATVVDDGVEAIVIDAAHPQVSIDFVYVPIDAESATGTLILSVYACPAATSPLAECAPRFVDGEIAIEGPGGIWLDRSNSDVSQRGDRRWENLPPGTYHLAANLLRIEDAGYSVARVDGADEYFEGVATVVIDTERPDAILDVVFAAGGPAPTAAGAIQVSGLICPVDPSAGDCWTGGELGDLSISSADGGVLTLLNGTSHGASYVWEGLPYGVYTFDALRHTPPAGTVFDHAQGAVTPTDTGYAIALDEATPFADVTLVYIAVGEQADEGVQEPDDVPAQAPQDLGDEPVIDGDGDGLSDDTELSLGLDPGSPDSDGDGFFDGDEWDAGTDPNDAISTP
jgi:hypothetical protein